MKKRSLSFSECSTTQQTYCACCSVLAHRRRMFLTLFLKCWGAWDTTRGHKTKDITPSMPGGERRRNLKRSTIFLERTRKGRRQSDQHWNYFKGNIRETPEMGWSAYIWAFPSTYIPSWTDTAKLGMKQNRRATHDCLSVEVVPEQMACGTNCQVSAQSGYWNIKRFTLHLTSVLFILCMSMSCNVAVVHVLGYIDLLRMDMTVLKVSCNFVNNATHRTFWYLLKTHTTFSTQSTLKHNILVAMIFISNNKVYIAPNVKCRKENLVSHGFVWKSVAHQQAAFHTHIIQKLHHESKAKAWFIKTKQIIMNS